MQPASLARLSSAHNPAAISKARIGYSSHFVILTSCVVLPSFGIWTFHADQHSPQDRARLHVPLRLHCSIIFNYFFFVSPQVMPWRAGFNGSWTNSSTKLNMSFAWDLKVSLPFLHCAPIDGILCFDVLFCVCARRLSENCLYPYFRYDPDTVFHHPNFVFPGFDFSSVSLFFRVSLWSVFMTADMTPARESVMLV